MYLNSTLIKKFVGLFLFLQINSFNLKEAGSTTHRVRVKAVNKKTPRSMHLYSSC